jgi:hypothetical protein
MHENKPDCPFHADDIILIQPIIVVDTDHVAVA